MSNIINNHSASLSEFVRLSGSTDHSVGNYYLEEDGKRGFILGIDNQHRHITGINKGRGLSGSEDDKTRNRALNLNFYKAFSEFVNASKYSKSEAVRAVLAKAGNMLLKEKTEVEPDRDSGLDTPLERRTVRALVTDLENAIKGEQGKFDKEHPLFKMKASEIFEAIKGQKCGGWGGWFAAFAGGNEADYFLKCVWKEGGIFSSDGGGIENVKGADQTNEAGNKMIRSYLSAALDKLAVDILKDVKSSKAGLTNDALNDIKSIRAKAKELMSEANIGQALSVKEAKSLAKFYDEMAEKYLPANGTTRKSAYDGGVVGKFVGSETLALQSYEDELARIRSLKVADEVPQPQQPPVVPPSQQFTNALKNVIGKTSLTLNAEQAANALLSPLLGHLKAHTSAFVGGVEVKTVAGGMLVLKLKNIVAKDFLGKLVPELVSGSGDPGSAKATAAGLGAQVNFGDLDELSISLVPEIVHEPVQGDKSNPPRTRSVLRLTVPKTGAWRVVRNTNQQTGISKMIEGVLEKLPENLLKGPGYEVKMGGEGDANVATVDVDLSALKVDALAKLGLSAADLTSLKVGTNGVQFGFCEPAGQQPANPQPGAGAAGFNAQHSLEAEIGTADLLTNAKTLVREHLTKKQEGLAHDSPEWQSLENNKGLLNGLGRLSLTTDPADETITLGADGMRLGDNPERLGAARSLVDTLNPSSLSVKLKPRMEAPGRLSAEVKGFSLTGSTVTAKLLSWALKFKPLRKIGFWLFKDKITAGVKGSLGRQATIVMQDNGWPKVTMPVGKFTQGIMGGATDVGAELSELKVTNRGVKFGIDVEHVVRNPIVAATNREVATLMAGVRTILGKQKNAITQDDTLMLETAWNDLIAKKTRIGRMIEAANRRRKSSTVKPISLADARVTLRQIEDDIGEFKTKLAALGINGPWQQA